MKYTFNEIEGFQQHLDIAIQKLQRLQKARLLENNPSVQFTLDTEIQELDTKIGELKKILSEVAPLDGHSGKKQGQPSKSSEVNFDKKKPTELDCYCCNRDDHFEPVIQFLEAQHAQSQLHIFLPAYPGDAPESFVTRVLYHLFPRNNFHSPSTRCNGGRGEQVNTMKLIETDLRPTPNIIQNIEREINTYLQPHYPENIVLFYRLDLKNWKPEKKCHEFIGDIHANKLPSISGKKLRIFYWLDPTGCPSGSGSFARFLGGKKNQLEIMKVACRRKEQICFLEPLPPVRQPDLHTWFSRLCSHEPAYEGVVASIFEGKEQLPMSKIEWHLLPLFQKTNQYR